MTWRSLLRRRFLEDTVTCIRCRLTTSCSGRRSAAAELERYVDAIGASFFFE